MSDLKLTNPDDARNFRYSPPRFLDRGRFGRLRMFALHCTRWFRPRTVVTAIDESTGIVTCERERWSWRRWRWERMPTPMTLDSFDAIKRHYGPCATCGAIKRRPRCIACMDHG